MAQSPAEKRFLRYQVRAIRRFQRIHQPHTPQEADRLAMEWIQRFAARARARWTDLLIKRTESNALAEK